MTKAMTHIDEKTLDLYVLDAEEVKPRRAEIQVHLKECSDCAELCAELAKYYEAVQQIKEERARATSQALTLRTMIVRVPPFDDRVPLSEIPKTLPARFVLFLIRHPVVSTLGAVSFLLAIFLLTYPREGKKDLNPAYARAKEEFLVAYNKNGEELWRKYAGEGFDFESPYTSIYTTADRDRVIKTIDVNGDGKNEIISIFGWAGTTRAENPTKNAVICYNADGREQWRYEFHRDVTVGKVRYSDDYKFYSMAVVDFDHSGTVEIIAIVTHMPWLPEALVRLNANDGSFVSEYWNNGFLGDYLVQKDIDDDGVKEIILGGENYRLGRACMAVFDPRKIEGHDPAPAGFYPEGVSPGKEKYYILFPATDLHTLWPGLESTVSMMTLTNDNLLEVWVLERITEASPPVYYYFDFSMKCVRVQGGDIFEAYHRRLQKEGKVSKKLDDKYYEELRQGVRYWDGEKFVNEPTMNKRYLEALKEPLVQR